MVLTKCHYVKKSDCPFEISEVTEEKLDSLDVHEMEIDTIKVEVKDEDLAQYDTEEEQEIIDTDNVDKPHKEGMLMRQSSHDFAMISDLFALLEEYKRMAFSEKSVLCCQLPLCQALLSCLLCGEQFMGKADRLLKLCKHFQSVHPNESTELILRAMERPCSSLCRGCTAKHT